MASFEHHQLFAYVRELLKANATERLAELEQEIAALKAKLAELQPRRPGRPRKVANG